MTKSLLEKKILDLACPLAASSSLIIWGIEILGTHKKIIKVYVDIQKNYIPGKDQSEYAQQNNSINLQHELTESTESVQRVESANHVIEHNLNNEFSDNPNPKQSNVTIEQCARFSRPLGLALEVEDIIPAAYTLEISSPGLDRKFFTVEQLQNYIGSTVELDLNTPISPFSGRKHFAGILKKVSAPKLTIAIDQLSEPIPEQCQLLDIFWDNLSKIKLLPIFKDTNLKNKTNKKSSLQENKKDNPKNENKKKDNKKAKRILIEKVNNKNKNSTLN